MMMLTQSSEMRPITPNPLRPRYGRPRSRARAVAANLANRCQIARTALPLAVALLAGCIAGDAPGLRSGDPAPALTLASLDGERTVRLADYRGQVLLVNLWATWCHPCREEIPYLGELYHRYRGDGLAVLGISVDLRSDIAAVLEYVDEMVIEYDIALDPDALSKEALAARGLPTTLVVNRNGSVAFSWMGPVPEGEPTFVAGLEAALARDGSEFPEQSRQLPPGGQPPALPKLPDVASVDDRAMAAAELAPHPSGPLEEARGRGGGRSGLHERRVASLAGHTPAGFSIYSPRNPGAVAVQGFGSP